MSGIPTRAPLLLVTAWLGLSVVLAQAASLSDYDAWQDADPLDPWYEPTTTEVNQILEWYQVTYPDQVQLVPIGVSEEGRLTYALRITDDPSSSSSWTRPSVILTGGHHGNEHAPPRVLLDYIDYLLDPGNASDPIYLEENLTIDGLIAGRQIWVIPIVNPDGYTAETRKNANGVDVNRDYEGEWILNEDTGIKDTTGPYPLSQPESWMLDNFFANMGSTTFLDMHTAMTDLYQTETDDLEDLYNNSDEEEDRICYCDTSSHIWCDIYDPGTHTVDTGVYIDDQYDPPSPAATADRFVAKEAYGNFHMVVNRTTYTWNSGTGTYGNSSTRTPSDDALHLLARPQSSGSRPAPTLPELAELANSGERLYAPYSPFDVCDTRHPRERGTGGMSRQSYNHARQKYGLYSYLLELPRFQVTDVFGDDERWITPGSDENVWWDGGSLESEVDTINQDMIAPLNRLADVAYNTVSAPVSGTYKDVAVENLYAVDGACLQSQVYPQVYDAHQGGKSVGRATWGQRSLKCDAANLGNQTNAFTLTLAVKDETTASTSSWSSSWMGVPAAARRNLTQSYTFVAGHRYTVSCVASNMSDTDVGTISVTDDQGCVEACAAGDCPIDCTASGGSYNRTWNTNNMRRLRFDAELDPATICDGGVELPTNVNGFPVGHIAAVVSP